MYVFTVTSDFEFVAIKKPKVTLERLYPGLPAEVSRMKP